MRIMEQQICLWCREDTSFGTGKFVNRIPASKQDSIDDEYETGYQCADCQSEECSVCKQSVIEYSFTENCDAICYECNPKVVKERELVKAALKENKNE